jgi:hypothetical protein
MFIFLAIAAFIAFRYFTAKKVDPKLKNDSSTK